MKNTRTKQTPIQRAMKIVTSITLLAMLFVLVIAGTLSGAFGVEENLVQNGKIEGNVASAEGVRTFQTIDLSGTFKNTTDTSININPDVAKRGGLYTTNENHLTNNKWETGNATTGGKWYIADNTNHSGSDYVCAWFVFDLGADYASRVYGDLNISLIGTYTNWNGGGVFAIESGNNLIELPTTTSDGDSTWYSRVRDGNFGVGAKYTKTNELKPKNDKKTEFPISLTHTVSGRYVRIHYATYDPSWNYNEHRFDNVKVTLSRKLAYYVNYDKNSTTATGTVVKSDKLEYFVDNTISNDVYVGNKYYFDHWNTKADNTGVNMAVGATTGTNTNSGFGKVVKDNLQAGTTTTTLYAQWNSISFVFNRQTYSVYNGEVLQVLQGHSDYLSSTVSSNYTSTITYKTLSGTSLSSAPTTVGNYIATITVSKGSQTRGAVDLPFAVIEGDFGKLPLGTSGKWGSETNPYVISTPVHLANLSGIVNGTQIALNTIVGSDGGAVTADDVVATDNTYTNCYFVVTANITVSSSFVRIAKDNSHYFKGNFNGQNYTISGLNCGLFGYVSGGTFKDLTLQGSVTDGTSNYYGSLIGYGLNITVSNVTSELTISTSSSYVGGLIGFCQNATITDCTNKGSVRGVNNVGGLVGWTGDESTSGHGATISNCTNNGNVNATGDFVGGIVGWNRDTIYTNVVNSGNINATGAQVGGITSRVLGGRISNAQNSGTINGGNYVGGIAGNMSWAYINDVSNSGAVSGNNYVGGLLGYGESDHASNLLIYGTLTNTASVSGAQYVGGIAGYLENKLTAMINIDWTATVNIATTTLLGADGVRGTSYMGGAIGFLGENITISGSISVSGCDIDNENGGNYLVGGAIGYNAGIVSADLTVDARVISRSTGTVNSISGAFTGGVVGYNAGTLSGALKKTSGDVISVSFNDYVGGIVGYNSGAIIGKMTHTSTNAMYENSTVYGATKVGGLVGYTSSALNISNAQNTGKIVGSVSVGGLVGYADAKCTINASTNTGSVSGTNNVGGIVGYAKGIDLSGVSNSATINGYTNVGGLVGNIEGGAAITTSGNSGAVNGYKHLGGFVGYAKSSGSVLSIEGTSTAPLVNGGKVTSAIPSGSSSANNDGGVAGFVGYLDGDSNLTISHCVNNGEIHGLQFNGIAGILGYVKHGANLIYINNCKNAALVEGGINTGGIGGRLSTNSSAVNSMVISHCYNSGEILTQDYSTGSTENSGTTGGICGYFNATSTTAASRTAVISYCYNVGNVKIVKSTSGQAFAQNDSNKGFIGGIVGNAKSNADKPDTNGKVAIEYCYVDLTSGHSILRYGIDMTTYINGTNLATVSATSYVIKKGTSITAGNSGSYLLYNNATTTFDYPLVDGTQTTWENIVTQNINGFRLTTNVAEGDYYESLKGVGGALLTPDNFTSVGSSSFIVEAKYTAEQGNIYLDTADIVLVSKTVTYDKQAHTIDAPTLPDDYTFTTLYFTTADAFTDGKGTTSRTDVDDNPYCTETKVLIGNTVVGRMADKNYGTLTITKRELTFTNTWSDALYPNVIDRATQNNFVYNTDYNGLQRNGVRVLNIVDGVKYADIFDITYTTPDQNGEGFLYRTAGTYFRKYTLKSTNYTIKDHADGIVEYKWTIAKNKLTIDNVWTSDNIGGSPYTFVYNGQNQGVKDVFVTAQPDTKGITHTPQASVYTIDQILYSTASFVKNVGVYSGTFTLNDTANYEIGTTAAYIDGVATANAIGLDGVTQNGNVITYAWKINQFDVGNAFESGKAWFGAGTDMVVANQNTVKTENVNGTEFAYYYLQANAGDTPKIVVYENANYNYKKVKFVLYVKYTTITNGVAASSIAKLVYDTDYTIANLATAGDTHVKDVSVTASGTGNFVGNAVKYYVVADSDFGGNINQANWGSESNPYVIEHESQLLRLSQIVNGGVAWNSINGTDGLVANTDAQATNRTYEGCYFVVNANVTLLQSSASGIEGFEPIGNSAYQFKAAQFAKGDGLDSVSIEYSFSDTAREYVGLFGYIDGTSIVGIDVVGKGTILGNKYVGGIVGYANGGKIENCTFSVESLSKDKVSGGDYVGGIVGYANGTTIVQKTDINTYGEFMQAKVVGASYVGGIAGEWIVTNANQINGDNYILSYAANLISVVGNGSYVGGIAGKLDASGCTTDLTYLGFYTNGKAGADDVMDVYGTSYVGALFGAFIGNGYHYDAENSGVRSVILVKSLDDIRANVIANDDGVGYVMGGLIGYAEKVGILIGCNWTSESMVKNGSTIAKTGVYVDAKGNTSFVGGLVGVLGENATIESIKQEVAVVGGKATISGGQYSVINKIAIKGKDFVGGLIGYIASSAGSYFGTTGTILGNSIKFYNEAQVEGANYVGGIVGGLGIVDGYANFIGSDSDDVLKNLLSATHNSKQSILGYSTLESDPYTQNPFGKLINVASVTGSGNYVGGIFGYVGDRVSLALENEPISTVMNVEQLDTPYGYLNVYNGNSGKTTDVAITIKGASYVGGIAGWLDNQAHDLTFVVNRSYVNGTTYAGGLVGYMRAGTITSSIAVAPVDVTTSTDTYIGTTYIGGLVGYVDHGTISGSMSTGFLYGNVNANNGGIIGNGISPTIENSWTIYVAKDATYSTVSTNDRGKYLLLDSSVENVPSLLQIVRMTGLYVADMTYLGNTYTVGKLLVNVSVPSANNNKQLAFYDVSGSDNVTDNMSVDGSGNVTATNFTKFGNFNDTDPNALTIEWAFDNANSFSVCTVAIEFVNIPNYKDKEYNQNTAAGKKNAQDAYREPSASKLYVAEVTNAEYWWYKDGDPQKGANNEGQIKKLTAVIYFKYQNTLVKVGETGNYRIGDYNKEYSNDSIGSKENPIIISTQAQWNEFAYSIYTGQKDYKNQYIRLTTDITISNGTHNDTNGNKLDFGAVASVPSNGSDASTNIGYNFAGNISQGSGDTLANSKMSFKGNLDGTGHRITINYTSGGYHRVSVFPNAGSGSTTSSQTVFKNLTITGNIDGGTNTTNAGYDMAGFVGKPFGAIKFENCTNAANIQGLRIIAGIAGCSTASAPIELISCVNKGNITSYEGSKWNRGTGQSIGYPDDYSYGTGGLIAYASANIVIDSCLNTGTIIGQTKVGGIVGRITGSSKTIATIKNCANTGHVEGQELNPYQSDSTKNRAGNAWSRVGGLVGEADKNTELTILASYNTGSVRGLSNVAGGLVGILGTIPDDEKPHSTVAKYSSTIAYSYNTGSITIGYEQWSGIPMAGTSGYNFNGTNAGGIVGVAVQANINYCYNTGAITAYGGVGYGGSWQSRNGGIVAEVVTNPKTGDNCYVRISNCYNVGKIELLESKNSTARYNADIVGYMEKAQDENSNKIKVTNCYGIANNIIIWRDNVQKYLSGWNDNHGFWDGAIKPDKNCVRTGTTLRSLADLTAVINSDGTVKPVSYATNNNPVNLWNASTATLTNDSSFNNATASGYIYMPGCLPQLAVFAVDTHNGLSMRSVNYGVDLYGEYVQQSAGNQFSPYVIKDGIDLLGTQSLVDLGYTFVTEYIEFANKNNNITLDTSLSFVESKVINMPTYSSTSTKIADGGDAYKSSTGGSTYNQSGKSYHLFALGAICRDDLNSTANSAYTTWLSRNYYYEQNSQSTASNATFSRVNFMPIGRKGGSNIFKGSISGKQADGTNTEVANLRIVSSNGDYAFAGLFARAESANISYISVSGSMKAYATNGKGHSIVGGIAADISGNTVIDHCNAGTTSRSLTLEAHGKNDVYSSNTVDQLHTYAGGIVGIANTSFYTGSTHVYRAGTTSVIKNCNTVYATVKSAKNNIGGVVGYASAVSLDGKQNADGKNNKIEITDNVVTKAELCALDAKDTGNSDIGTKVGGVLGYSDKYIAVIISGCTVGTDSTTKSVTIKGENAIGGIVGAMPNAINEIKDCAVKASTLIKRGNSWGIVENVKDKSSGDSGNHGTAIGGIIGYTYHNTSENAVTTTLSGNISFAGTIKIDYATQDDAVRNVGGVFGDMASGASFATGAVINVSGAIEIADSIKTNAQNAENSGVRNIGGVAGRTRDVAFSGNFTVSVTINIPNAYYVGGFIGRNRGEVNILADDTTINIGAKLNGAHDVGGFIGDNDASTGAILYIGANEYRRTRYEKPLSIVISQEATISASGDNVGGIVGGNTSNGGSTVGAIRIVKGSITNNGTVSGANAVGGIIGNNNAGLVTGGGTGSDAVKKLTIVNGGAVSGNNYIGGVIGKLNRGTIAGTFVNNGDVTGQLFVGGSIGYVAFDAVITVAGGVATEFKNGAKEDAYTASGDALTAGGDTVAQGVGTVKGKAYVGGSIGIMLGKIVGNANAKVVFTSSGIVDASDVAGYLGGSIGVIAGQVDYAQFISTGELTGINAITAVGGSVGFIGAPTPLLTGTCTEEYAIDLGGALFNRVHIKNSHFESNGNVKLIGSSAKIAEAKKNDDGSEKGEFEWGGVGGAIGVIAGVSNGFNGGNAWENNTYYAEGNITAPGIYNVGGIVGFIRANGIKINNLLAYDITVDGATNVGGIIGSTIGTGTVIEYAFSISSTDGTGLFTASDANGQAGGIIGKAASDTDASTSYWVKGYKNAELAGTDASRLKDTLGLYTAITEKIQNPDGSYTTVIFTKELVGTTAENGSADTENAIYPTPYDYIDAVGAHVVNGENVTLEKTYTTDETTGEITKRDWTWYFGEYYTNAEFANDTWVLKKPDWKAYSTGTEQTGWYFVYANDTVTDDIVGTVDAAHKSATATNLNDKDFWKRIANAYTNEERKNGDDVREIYSTIVSSIDADNTVSGGGLLRENNLYATATAANENKSGYYLYIASSGTSRPTAIHGTNDDKFYIQINTAIDKTTIAKNVAVYYRSIAMGSALTYNGYNRYAPISLQKDIKSEPGITDGKVDPTKKNSYAYTTELVEPQTVAKTVGTYKSNVFVYYYDDTGKAYKVGGITQGAWKIKQRALTFNATSVNNKVYGDKDIESKVTIQNVAPNDRDAITFVLSIKGVDTPITISDLKAGKSYLAKEYQGIEITLVTASQDGALSGADANFIAETITDKTTYKIEFNIKFTNAKKYEISTSLADGLSKTNYVMSNSNQNVEVKKRGIDVKIDSGNKSAFFDGKYTHGTTWTFSNIADEAFGDTWQSVLKAFSPLFVADIEKEGGGYNTYTSDLVGKNSLTYNKVTLQYDGLNTGRITFTGAGDVGNYYLRFSDYGQNDVNNTSNYYIKLTDGESESYAVSKNMLNITWSRTNNGTHVYDKSTIGTITASVVADHGIENFDSFVETYFTREWAGTKGEPNIVVASSDRYTTATITFKTLVNAGKYTAKLAVNKQTHQDKINCSYKFLNGNTKDDYSTFEYKIDKRTLSVSFDYTGENGNKSTGYIYTTQHQGLYGIKVDNLITAPKGDTVGIRIVVTGENVVYQYNTQSQNVSYSGTGVKEVANISTIDVGTYHVTATLSSNANYQLSSTTDSWEIKKYSISLSGLTSSSKIYDGIPFKPTVYINNGATTNGEAPYKDDLITVNYKATSDKFGNGFVNKGEYTVSIGKGDITAKRKNTGSDTTLNYDVTANQSAQFTITARPITVKWNPTQTFIYNGQIQGITLASAEGGGQVKLTSCDVSSAQITGYAGKDVIHLTLGGGKVHVKDIPFAMTAAIDRVTGKNSDGSDSVAENYELIVDTAENDGTYNIVAASLRLEYTSGVVIKEYDATVSANVSDLTFRVVSNTAATLQQSSFKITGVYLDKNVGNEKTVKVTVKCNDTSGDFAYVGADTFEIAKVGSITPKELEVKLDKLRSGKATRVYNGATWYGGEKGAMYSSGTSARSAVYRSGEGFVVDGFPSAEQNGTVTISAVYKEADAKRGEFDSYVNFVYVDENKVYHKGTVTNKLFKTLVFSISGECAQNYTFKVTNGTDAYSGTVGNKDQSVTVYDSRDEQNKDKRPANAGNINIEITVKSFKVEYTNMSQSYANSDNTYNTDWKPVEATKTPDGTTVTVLNGWMTDESGNPKTYNKYTVIRGRMGSKQLSAQVSGEKGMEHNYNMSNQPILTIGYFVDKTDFEVGSIASLMIASYYWYASQHADSPDFTPIVSAGSEWVSIVTNEVYGTGAFGESNKPADAPKDCNSWDEYFAYIEQKENVTVFLNEYEKNSWGYYKTTQTTTKPAYTSYRQTADFTGIVKQADIEILNNFFTTYTFGEDGTATPTQHMWGKGGEYITNFLKPSVGNVLTALGSVFVSTGDGFGGTYNGNGYVIEYLNIYGFGGATQNVGMFDKIGNGSVSGLHLRNVTISANGGNVGGIAGEILAGEASSDVTNVSFHGSITVSGSGNVGGLFGKSARKVEKAIVLGSITANGGSVAGVVGSLSGTLSSVVSLMQVDASGTVAPIANGGTVTDSTYLANAVWSKDGNGKIAYAGGNGTAKSYAELMGGSISGYGKDNKYYYAGDTPNQKGVYDVIDDVALTSIDVQNNSNPRQSMRLRDIVDVYLLMYSLSETTATESGDINGARTYTISTTSWLVGEKHGTSKDDAIVIANKQNVALLRQLRFATFVLMVDLTSYEAQSFGGAFYGTIYQNGHSIPTDWLNASFADVTKATIVNE